MTAAHGETAGDSGLFSEVLSTQENPPDQRPSNEVPAKSRAIDPLSSLTADQRSAVEHRGGPLAVLAGPGTGKTRVLTHRVADYISSGTPPESIVALTFTNKAAEEMRVRLGALVGGATADRVFVGTFHRFASRLLLRFGDLAGLPARPDLTDPALERRLMRSLVRDALAAGEVERRASDADDIADRALGWTRHLLHSGVLPVEAASLAERWRELAEAETDPVERDAQRVESALFAESALLFRRYDELLVGRRLVTYDQLLTLPIRLLTGSDLARTLVRQDYRVVLVDEFQDVNPAQIRLLAALAPPQRNPELTVVGDDDQAIYGFRGATDLAFKDFAERYPAYRAVELSDNFRSSRAVVEAANAIIARAHARAAPDKRLVPRRIGLPDPVPAAVEGVTLESNDQIESTLVAMLRLDRERHPERPWSSRAVICQTNKEIPSIAGVLELAGIPTRVTRRRRQADETAVRDLLAWATLITDPSATYAAQRLLLRPPVGFDAATVGSWLRVYRTRVARSASLATDGPPAFVEALRGETLATLSGGERDRLLWFIETAERLEDAAQRLDAAGAIREVLTSTGLAVADLPEHREYVRRVHLLSALLRFAEERARFFDEPKDLLAFLGYWEDLGEADAELPSVEHDDAEDPDDQPDGVVVLTAHKSKGLEFDTVFVPRIGPSSGYGRSQPRGAPSLPQALLPGPADARSAGEKAADEQRRLFYVAGTRAERRLVLLSKRVRSANDRNFFQNLETDGLLSVASRAAVLERARGSGIDCQVNAVFGGVPGREGEAGRARRFELVVADARRRAAAAFFRAAHGDNADLQEQTVVRAIREIAAARALLTGQDPGAIAPPSVVSAVRAAMPETPEPGVIDPREPEVVAPQRGPLTLDYSKIRLYHGCPLCYYVKHVARLGEPPSARATVGTLTHRALERYYRAVQAADADGRPLPGFDLLRASAERAFSEAVERGPVPPRETLERVIDLLRRAHGSLHDPAAHIVAVERDVSVPFEVGGVAHTLRGRIDRIDLAPDGSPVIIDFKTGGSASLREPKPDDLQLGIYLELLKGTEFGTDDDEGPAGRAEYWLLADGVRGGLPFGAMKVGAVRKKIAEAIEGILEGRFRYRPQYPYHVCDVVRNADQQPM
ncbi:MAG: ATP-dependent DNA helicase [Planctomycetota bacterium]